jgi:hypothetical protein
MEYDGQCGAMDDARPAAALVSFIGTLLIVGWWEYTRRKTPS